MLNKRAAICLMHARPVISRTWKNRYLELQGHNFSAVMGRVKEVIGLAVLAAAPELHKEVTQHSGGSCLPSSEE